MNNTPEKAKAILAILKETHPDAHIALNFTSPWELLVAVILSAQCTDVMVNKVMPELLAAYPTPKALAEAAPADVETLIKRTGFYKAKAKNIMATAKLVVERFGGEVPRTMQEITTLPGVARKTGNAVLGNAYGIIDGIAVDTHVLRLSQRLRLVDPATIGGKKELAFVKSGRTALDFKKDGDPAKIEQQLMTVIPKDQWLQATYYIVDHGRAICKSQRPNCPECPLNHLCPASRV